MICPNALPLAGSCTCSSSSVAHSGRSGFCTVHGSALVAAPGYGAEHGGAYGDDPNGRLDMNSERRLAMNAGLIPDSDNRIDEMDLHEAVMLVVFDVRKSNPDFSARQAIDSALANVDRSDVVNTGGDLEIAFLMVLDHASNPSALGQAVRDYAHKVMPTRTSGRLSPMAQDAVMHAREVNGVCIIETDDTTSSELERHGLAIRIRGGQTVLTGRGEHARVLIPIL